MLSVPIEMVVSILFYYAGELSIMRRLREKFRRINGSSEGPLTSLRGAPYGRVYRLIMGEACKCGCGMSRSSSMFFLLFIY